MSKVYFTGLALLFVLFFAGGCVEVETIENSQSKPQVDQVSEESAVYATTTNEVEMMETGDEITATDTAMTSDAETASESGDSVSTGSSPNELPNAKREYCQTYSGIYSEITTPDETWGACYFKDGTMCEILSFMRGECQVGGGCHEECWSIGTKDEGWYESCNKKLIRWDKCSLSN